LSIFHFSARREKKFHPKKNLFILDQVFVFFFFFSSAFTEKGERTKSLFLGGRSVRMRPIASNYSEKLKHDSFTFCCMLFRLCFYFVLYFNTCVNIFVLLKQHRKTKRRKKRAEGPLVLHDISQFPTESRDEKSGRRRKDGKRQERARHYACAKASRVGTL
jgi:hypothetical protein